MINQGNINAIRNQDGSIDYSINYTVDSENELFCRDDINNIKIKESDGIWYYLHLGLFFIKVPVDFIDKNYSVIDDTVWEHIEGEIIKYILFDYYSMDEQFRDYINENNYDISDIKQNIINNEKCVELFCDKCYDLTDYFDEWAIIEPDASNSRIDRISIRPRSKKHIETISWE